MMINKRSVLVFIGILFLVFVIVKIGFLTDPNNPHRFSLVYFTQQKNVLATELKNKSQKQIELNQIQQELLAKKQENDVVAQQAEESTERFLEISQIKQDSGEWIFHVPSLLINFEQAAKKAGIDIAIDFELLSENTTKNPESEKDINSRIAKAKVEVSGDYHAIREHIKQIESIDFISVESLEFQQIAEEDRLVGQYTMRIHYFE